MWMKWFPWRWMAKQWAKGNGFFDPVEGLSQIQRFAQPSEVAIPVEIMRLATGLHLRGLINSQAIQHNLDWVWPFWVERQFDPHDISFVPRAFSISHINLTHRNWTAVGIPDCAAYPIVDPAGLVTPLFDSWSIDSWIIGDSPEEALLPSKFPESSQKLLLKDGLSVLTESASYPFRLSSQVEVTGDPGDAVCQIRVTALSNIKAKCVISLRPYNPEGICFIHEIAFLEGRRGWLVNNKSSVYLNETPAYCAFSDYRKGDIPHSFPLLEHREKVVCDVGLATAAAAYELEPGKPREIVIAVPLQGQGKHPPQLFQRGVSHELWSKNMEGTCKLQIPDEKFQFLYDAAVKTILLHSPKEVYPGPYTYKHFWFRDAAFILNAMLSVGLEDRAEKVIDSSFFSRQNASGYFHSQDGEWDSNGQALWSLLRFCQLSNRKPKPEWKPHVERGVKWIQKKRLPETLKAPHAGLFPPGFSAEHLGPNDYYYWDDFWGAAGLAAASELEKLYGDSGQAASFGALSKDFLRSIERSLSLIRERLGFLAIPASPYRRMDSGAIGSIAASYPLQLLAPRDARLLATAEYMMQNCRVDGGFFHDMSHSGINPYLTLHIAQVLLRAGDSRYYEVMKAIADLASPTGQWPEAIHPKTKGGCMGDGQHVWAAAEWILMIRNCFVREEGDRLILFSGIPQYWLDSKQEISFGPAPTRFGSVSLSLKHEGGRIQADWKGEWCGKPPKIEVCLHEAQEAK